MYGRAEVMGEVLRPYKIRTAADMLPCDDSYQISKWELGTQVSGRMVGEYTRSILLPSVSCSYSSSAPSAPSVS